MNSNQENEDIEKKVVNNDVTSSFGESDSETRANKVTFFSEKVYSILVENPFFQSVRSFIKSFSPIIWIVVIAIIVINLLGKISIANIGEKYNYKSVKNMPDERVIINTRSINPQINSQLITALKDSRISAENYASEKLDEWINQLRENVNDDFLNWYFNYFTQLNIGFKATLMNISSLMHQVSNPNQSNIETQKAEKLTEDFQREFAKRVLKPEIAQIKLERFTRETVNVYVSQLSKELTEIQSEYKIPQADWERYLNGVSATITDSTGNNQDISLRVLSRGTEYLVALPLSKLTVKVGTGLATKITEGVATKLAVKGSTKVATKISTKAAGKVAAELAVPTLSTLALELIDPLAAVGILAWDIWDNYHTDEVERPIMRKAIFEYLDEMKQVLLYNPHDSIMSAIYSFEASLLDKLEKNQSS